ncbi:MAG: TetR/AcrR family transcriptional regulator [Clostridiales bacterium]|nr:TetR/AcrR family transcriptional regulator [Clostridiales bacterium]
MTKEEKLNITKEKLLTATMQLMREREDPLSVTTRQIAARADVKPSMINYCFGTRDKLLHKVFEKEYESFLIDKGVMKILESGQPPKDILKQLHFVVAQCLLENFNFTQVITNFVLFKRDLTEPSFSVQYVKAHYNGKKTDEECKLIAYEMSTMMQLIIYRKDEIKKGFGIDLDNDDDLKHVIDMRIDLLLGGK